MKLVHLIRILSFFTFIAYRLHFSKILPTSTSKEDVVSLLDIADACISSPFLSHFTLLMFTLGLASTSQVSENRFPAITVVVVAGEILKVGLTEYSRLY